MKYRVSFATPLLLISNTVFPCCNSSYILPTCILLSSRVFSLRCASLISITVNWTRLVSLLLKSGFSNIHIFPKSSITIFHDWSFGERRLTCIQCNPSSIWTCPNMENTWQVQETDEARLL
jgi:hypothetical protein